MQGRHRHRHLTMFETLMVMTTMMMKMTMMTTTMMMRQKAGSLLLHIFFKTLAVKLPHKCTSKMLIHALNI
jgi:hypothetical protein